MNSLNLLLKLLKKKFTQKNNRMIKVNKAYISFLIFFSFQLQAKLILPTVNWVDSAITEGVKKINSMPKNGTDYSVIIDVAKFVNTNPNYAVTLQSNTWHYETGNSSPQNFNADPVTITSLENDLATFNNGRTDNVRLYSIFIKNIPFIINGKLNNFNPDTSISLNDQINLLIQNNPKDYSKLQAIFSHIITSIKNQSNKDALIYGVGHFYTKYKRGNHFQGFFCDYFDAKNTGPLADANKVNCLKAVILDQRKNESYGSVRGRSALIISTLIENIKCTIDNNCGDLKLPLDLATQTFFDEVPNRQPLITSSIAPGTSNVELFDLSGLMDPQTEQNTLYSWVQVCNQKGFKLKVFLTDNNTNPNLIRQTQQFKGTLSGTDKTIFLWLHQSSDLKTYADFAVSDGVSTHFDKAVLYKGIDNYIQRSKSNLQQLEDLPGKMVEGLAVWINSNIKIPEKYYNTQATDYDPFIADMYTFGICGVNSNCDQFFGGIASKVGLGITPSQLPQCHFAFVCGIWNGAIGQVSGVFELCGTLGQSTKRSEFFSSIKTLFTTPFDQTWQAIKTQLITTYGTINNPSITAHNYGILIANIAGCFVGTGEIKALLVGEKIVVDVAKFAKLARLFSKSFVGIGNKAVKLGNFLVEIVTDGGKIIIKQLKNGEQVINNAIDFATGSVQWDGQKLLALTPNGSFEMSLVDDVFDSNNNKIGKLYEYGANHEPVFVGTNKETVVKTITGSGKTNLLTKLNSYINLKTWVNTLDEVNDVYLISKLDELTSNYLSKLDADISSISNGTSLKLLLKESPEDLTNIWKFLKDDPKYSFELAKTGGSRWEKWAQGNFFKTITQAGKDFELFVSNNLSVLRSKLLSKYPNIDLNDYAVFEQVQIKTGQITNGADEFFVADFILVKKELNAITGVENLNFNNAIVLETKLSSTTALTTPQTNALAKVKTTSNTFDIRSLSKTSTTNNAYSLGASTSRKTVKVTDYIKVNSDGIGNIIQDVTSLK